jgi:cobalamin synthase
VTILWVNGVYFVRRFVSAPEFVSALAFVCLCLFRVFVLTQGTRTCSGLRGDCVPHKACTHKKLLLLLLSLLVHSGVVDRWRIANESSEFQANGQI